MLILEYSQSNVLWSQEFFHWFICHWQWETKMHSTVIIALLALSMVFVKSKSCDSKPMDALFQEIYLSFTVGLLHLLVINMICAITVYAWFKHISLMIIYYLSCLGLTDINEFEKYMNPSKIWQKIMHLLLLLFKLRGF